MTLTLLSGLALVLVAIGYYHTRKPLPAGLSYRGDCSPLKDPLLLIDSTRHHSDGSETCHQEIFDEVFRLIGQAEHLVLIDMFLFNGTKAADTAQRPLARQLTEVLVTQKRAKPQLQVLVISDPLNTLYGGTLSPWFEALRAADIRVVETDLTPLRDSNPAWSSFWRLACKWLGNNPRGGWLKNALGEQPVTLRGYLALPNFKANHRKVLVVDEGEELRALITSANPHEGSSRHHNLGLSFCGPAVADVLRSERAILAMSGAETALVERWLTALNGHPPTGPRRASGETGRIAVLTESAIRDRALEMLAVAGEGDRIDLAVFYLSHRQLVGALLSAHKRGALVRVVLDANSEAFGYRKSGIPNRQVALEMHRGGVPVRWCHTQGEQCHSKLLMVRPGQGDLQILLGSANFTRRNLDDLNLETSAWLSVANGSRLAQKTIGYFEQLWHLGPGADPVMSLPYEAWEDESSIRYWRYRVMEATGLSTF